MRRLIVPFAIVLGFVCTSTASRSVYAAPPTKTCDDAKRDELTRRIEKRWPRSEVRFCAAGRFGAPGYVVAIFGENVSRLGILAESGGPDLGAFIDILNRGVATSLTGLAAADLDGDGVDEVIEWWRRSAHGLMGSNNWLDVRRIERGKLGALISGPHTSIYYPDRGSCFASFSADRNGLVVTVENTHEVPPSECLPVGAHRFTLKKGVLVKSQ